MDSAPAEGDVRIALPGQDEVVGIVEDRLVPVARRVHHHDLVTWQDRLAAQFVFGDAGAPEVLDNRSPPQEFLDRLSDTAVEVLPQPGSLLGKVVECLGSETGSVPGGVGGGDGGQHHRCTDLELREPLTIDLGLHETGQQVFGGILAALGNEFLGQVMNHQCRFDLHLGGIAARQQLGVGPCLGFVRGVRVGGTQVVGDPEHVTEQLDRQMLGDVRYEVDRFAVGGLLSRRLNDPLCAGCDVVLDSLNLARGEGAADQPADLLVLGVVHRQEGHGHLQEHRRQGVEHDTVSGHEHVRLLADLDDVLVAHHGPEARVIGVGNDRGLDRRLPGDRAVSAQLGEYGLAFW